MLKFITLGGLIYKIPGVGPLAQRMAAELVKNGGKIIRLKKGQTPPNATTATAANVAKAVKNLKKSNTGAGRPTGKKPGSNVKKKNETVSSSQQAVSTGGKAKKGGLKTKKREIPANVKVRKTKPGKGGPFAKRTKKQKEADAKREKIQAQNRKNDNRRNPSRDPKGKYSERPVGPSTVPKVKPKPKPMTRRGKLVRGGTAILTGTQLLDLKGSTPQPVTKKVTPKTGQGRPSAIPSNRKKTTGVRPNLDKNTNTKKEMTFDEKFDRSRNKDKVAVFDFKGKKYTTRLKEESIKDHKKKFGVTGKY